jgi:hypothetical protein
MAKARKVASKNHEHEDFVIDTNILANSANDGSPHQADCLRFIVALSESGAFWALDDNGKNAPVIDTSLLWAEYGETVSPQAPAMLILQSLLGDRVCFADRPDERTRKLIRALVPANKRDQVILGAATGAGSRRLVSGDFSDFSVVVRKSCAKNLKVFVLDADEGLEVLSDN